MANAAANVACLGNFFATSAARLDCWRKLDAKHEPDPLVPFGHDNCFHGIEQTVSPSFGAQAC
jgi:hypothetical protein